MSDTIRPFYGETRLLSGHIVKKGRLYSDAKSDSHPIRNGWWNGIPHPMGQAVVMGEPYLALWPKYAEKVERRGELCFASVDDWLSGKTVESVVGRVPKNLAQGKYSDRVRQMGKRGKRTRNTYPKTWPFDGPFSDT
jgi:hypothetical protein